MPFQIDLAFSQTALVLLAANLMVWPLHFYLRRQLTKSPQTHALPSQPACRVPAVSGRH